MTGVEAHRGVVAEREDGGEQALNPPASVIATRAHTEAGRRTRLSAKRNCLAGLDAIGGIIDGRRVLIEGFLRKQRKWPSADS